ncbi:helix-turn-helix domain-containing protein [Cysteiniphilum sp. 6C5]|uniref:helix-turn-helix domain-containing protein n=1 Tax=unclassified Cysteiniphilum TaxID=2610889 RepID=UPI003F83A28F
MLKPSKHYYENHLIIVHTLLQTQSREKACKRLNISSQQLYYAIKKIEQEFNIILFENASSYKISNQGLLFKDFLQQLFSSKDDDKLKSIRQKPTLMISPVIENIISNIDIKWLVQLAETFTFQVPDPDVVQLLIQEKKDENISAFYALTNDQLDYISHKIETSTIVQSTNCLASATSKTQYTSVYIPNYVNSEVSKKFMRYDQYYKNIITNTTFNSAINITSNAQDAAFMNISAFQLYLKHHQILHKHQQLVELPKEIGCMTFLCIYNPQLDHQQKALLTQVAGVLKAAMEPFALAK